MTVGINPLILSIENYFWICCGDSLGYCFAEALKACCQYRISGLDIRY